MRPPPGDRKWLSSANVFNSKNSKFTSKVISLLWRDDTLLFIHSFICRVIYVMAKWVLAWFFFWLNQYIRHCVFMLMPVSLLFCFVFLSYSILWMSVLLLVYFIRLFFHFLNAHNTLCSHNLHFRRYRMCIWRVIHELVKTIHRTSNASEWINCDVPLFSAISDITNGTGILENKIQIRIDKLLYIHRLRWTINEKNQNKNCFFFSQIRKCDNLAPFFVLCMKMLKNSGDMQLCRVTTS